MPWQREDDSSLVEDGEFGRVSVIHGGEQGHSDENGLGYGSKTPDMPITIDEGSHFGQAIALRDIDGNGTLDLIGSAPGNSAVVTLIGVGDGEFTATGAKTLDLPGDSGVSLGQ